MNVDFYSNQSSFSPGFISTNPQFIVPMMTTAPIDVQISESAAQFNPSYSSTESSFETGLVNPSTPSVAPIQHIALGGVILPIQNYTVNINAIDISLLVQSAPFVINGGSSTEVI